MPPPTHTHSQTWREEIQLGQAVCGISALPKAPSPISSRMEMTPVPSQQPKPWKLTSSQVLAASHPPNWGIYHPKLAINRGTRGLRRRKNAHNRQRRQQNVGWEMDVNPIKTSIPRDAGATPPALGGGKKKHHASREEKENQPKK